MNAIMKFLTSSVGKKYLMSLTGLALLGFLVGHLLGNLQLLLPGELGHYYFNKYAYHLEELKPLVILAELGLIALVALHIAVALAINLGASKARPVAYLAGERSKGGESKSNLSSRNMLLLGVVIAIFVIGHVIQFKYGPGMDNGYVMDLHGEKVRDLHRLVVQTFANPIFAVLYVAALGFLGFHLRHGVWSAFQSLGAMPGKASKALYCAGAAFGMLLALGFIVLPIWLFVAVRVLHMYPL